MSDDTDAKPQRIGCPYIITSQPIAILTSDCARAPPAGLDLVCQLALALPAPLLSAGLIAVLRGLLPPCGTCLHPRWQSRTLRGVGQWLPYPHQSLGGWVDAHFITTHSNKDWLVVLGHGAPGRFLLFLA